MAKEREIDISRLCMVANKSRKVLQRFRAERREAVREYVGNHWSNDGSREKRPLNLISLYVELVGRSLVSKNPRVMLSTFDRANKPAVSAMQTWANREITRMKFANTLKRVVVDALFSVGIMKVALATPAESALLGWNQSAGEPFAERVDLDDFVFDVHARDFSEVSFIGHRYRVPLDIVKESKLYSKARKDLSASTDSPYNLEGDERVSALGRWPYASDSEEFEDAVDLWEFYLPRHRLIVTLADDQMTGPGEVMNGQNLDSALRVQNWVGPEHGPYHILGYGIVPGNAMAKGPVMDLIDLDDAVNRIYRKLIRQAERQKEVLAVSGGAMEDGKRVMEANDGEIIRVDNPERMKPATFGGPDQKNMIIGGQLKDLFNWRAGNLDMIGGLAPQSKTLGQDQLLAQNASRTVSDLQDSTVEYVAGAVKALSWYWWHDPVKTMKVHHPLPGIPDMGIQRQVTPQQRMRGRFEDLEVEVDPYSMQHQTPESRLAGLNQVVTQTIMPMMQVLQQQGVQFDVNAYLQKVGTYMNQPDLAEIVTIADPPQPDGGAAGAGQSPTMPQNTTRNYVRRSLGANSPDNKQADMMNQLSEGANAPQQ